MMQIIGACFKNTSRVYSYYCTVDDVKIGDALLTPDDTIVTVAALDVDPATISERVMPLMKTITKRAEEATEVVTETPEQTDLITIQQLPVIVEQLHSIKAAVSEKVTAILAMACTDSTIQVIKKARADLNKEFKDFEARRRFVKNEIMKPYEAFESVYKECISDIFNGADVKLKEAIDDVEVAIKQGKANEVSEFYRAELAAHGLDFPSFGQSGIKVGLSDSITALKKQSSEIISKTADEVAMISGLPYADEIMVEYRNTLNASRSVTTINERHKAIEAQRARMDAVPSQAAFEPIPVQPAVPRVIVATHTDDEITKTFRITGSQRKIDALVQFLEDGWYKYEVEA